MNTALTDQFDRLDAKLESLLASVGAYTPDQLNHQPGPGRWSVLQVMYHLLLAEEFSMKYVQKKLSFQPKLEKAGWSASWRAFLLRTYLNLPFKFKAPAGVGDQSFPEQLSLSEIAQRWQANRQQLRQYVQSLPAELFDKAVYKHPFAGRLSLQGMLDFFEHHFDRHHKQIQQTLS